MKALGLDSTDSAMFCVTRAMVSEREQETCCSPEPVRTRTTRVIPPLMYHMVYLRCTVNTLSIRYGTFEQVAKLLFGSKVFGSYEVDHTPILQQVVL